MLSCRGYGGVIALQRSRKLTEPLSSAICHIIHRQQGKYGLYFTSQVNYRQCQFTVELPGLVFKTLRHWFQAARLQWYCEEKTRCCKHEVGGKEKQYDTYKLYVIVFQNLNFRPTFFSLNFTMKKKNCDTIQFE